MPYFCVGAHKKKKHSTERICIYTLLTTVPQLGERRAAKHCCSLRSRKRQVCCHIKQINREVRRKNRKKALLCGIDLRVSACCQRNGFFSPVRQSFLQTYDVSTDQSLRRKEILPPPPTPFLFFFFFSVHAVLRSHPIRSRSLVKRTGTSVPAYCREENPAPQGSRGGSGGNGRGTAAGHSREKYFAHLA